MTKHLTALCLICLFGVTLINAQTKIQSGLSVRALFVDYHTLNDGDVFDFQDWNGGFEIGYIGHFSDKVSLYVPIKVSEVALPEAQRTLRMIGADLQGQYHFIGRTRKVNPYATLGLGITSESGDESHFSVPAGLGARVYVGPRTDIVGEAAIRLSPDDDRNHFHVGLGFNQRFGPVETPKVMETMDRDGDGIEDQVDLCPDVAGLEKYFGCPDTDKDGLPDTMDECPEVAGDAELNGCPDRDADGTADKDDDCPDVAGPASNNGCPEITDRDNDGVIDAEDDCPDEPGTPANRGCPEIIRVIDSDGDGVADKDDLCPHQAGSISGRGCPDTDGDGVIDRDDRCITIPGPASNLGCPEMKQEDKATLEFAVQAVEFDFGKATLRSSSFSILDRIADIMKRYPNHHLRISGHTDNVGDASRNQLLSERRARSCYEYLSTKGVSVKRMSYVGKGEVEPVADNDTEDGRSRNRRVEFDVFVQ